MESSNKTIGDILDEFSNVKDENIEKTIDDLARLIYEKSEGVITKEVCYIKARNAICWAKECYMQLKNKTLGEMADNVVSAYGF